MRSFASPASFPPPPPLPAPHSRNRASHIKKANCASKQIDLLHRGTSTSKRPNGRSRRVRERWPHGRTRLLLERARMRDGAARRRVRAAPCLLRECMSVSAVGRASCRWTMRMCHGAGCWRAVVRAVFAYEYHNHHEAGVKLLMGSEKRGFQRSKKLA